MGSARLRLHPAKELLAAVIGRSRFLKGAANISDRLALVKELLSAEQLADILLGVWRLRFMGLLLAKSGRLGSSHKYWLSFWGQSQRQRCEIAGKTAYTIFPAIHSRDPSD